MNLRKCKRFTNFKRLILFYNDVFEILPSQTCFIRSIALKKKLTQLGELLFIFSSSLFSCSDSNLNGPLEWANKKTDKTKKGRKGNH